MNSKRPRTADAAVDQPDGPELVARPSWGRRLIGIEGLRGIAAISVVFHHVGQHLTDTAKTGLLGHAAVLATNGLTLFFALSGFLLFRPFAAAILAGRRLPSLSGYARNRVLRIYPAYFVILLLVSFVFGAAYTAGAPDLAGDASVGYLTNPAAIGLNLLLVQTYVPGFLLTGIGTAWSLTAEIAFYIVLPMLAFAAVVLCVHRVNRVLAVTLPALLLIATGLTTTVLVARERAGLRGPAADQFSWGQTWTAVLDRSFLSQADLFGYGMAAAVVVVILHRRGVTSLPGWVKGALLVGSLIGLLVATAGPFGALATNAVGVACAMLILAAVLPGSTSGSNGNAIARVLEWLPFRYVGLISYSIYLWHIPVIWWLRVHGLTFGDDIRGLLLNLTLVLAVTLTLSSATYFFVERPALKLKSSSKRPEVIAAGGAVRARS